MPKPPLPNKLKSQVTIVLGSFSSFHTSSMTFLWGLIVYQSDRLLTDATSFETKTI